MQSVDILPKIACSATVKERRKYYQHVFPHKMVKEWFVSRGIRHPVFAIDVGSKSGIYDPRHSSLLNRIIYLSGYKTWNQLRNSLAYYAPEEVYYSRNIFFNREKCNTCNRARNCFSCNNFQGQELVFDIDVDNVPDNVIKCDFGAECSHDQHYCNLFRAACTSAARLPAFLKTRFAFKKIQIVYTGRGFQIHVFDRKACLYSISTRTAIAKIVHAAGFPVDVAVTSGSSELARVPYTLHGLVNKVSTIVTPDEIEKSGFEPN